MQNFQTEQSSVFCQVLNTQRPGCARLGTQHPFRQLSWPTVAGLKTPRVTSWEALVATEITSPLQCSLPVTSHGAEARCHLPPTHLHLLRAMGSGCASRATCLILTSFSAITKAVSIIMVCLSLLLSLPPSPGSKCNLHEELYSDRETVLSVALKSMAQSLSSLNTPYTHVRMVDAILEM